MTDRELVEAVRRSIEVETDDDYERRRKIQVLLSVWDEDPWMVVANYMGLMWEKEKAMGLMMAQAQEAMNRDGRSAA